MRNTAQDPSVIPLSAAQYRELAAAVCQAACFWQFSESMRFNLWAALRSRFGVSRAADLPASCLPDALSLCAQVREHGRYRSAVIYSAEKAYIKAKFPDQLPRALLTLAHELANSEVL